MMSSTQPLIIKQKLGLPQAWEQLQIAVNAIELKLVRNAASIIGSLPAALDENRPVQSQAPRSFDALHEMVAANMPIAALYSASTATEGQKIFKPAALGVGATLPGKAFLA